MRRSAFTAIEALLSIGVIAVTAGISVPLVRNYQLRNDLNIATDYMLQALRTAQSNARSGKNTGEWGVYVPDALVYEGASYEDRIVASDESYPLPPTVQVDGLTEVSFDAVSGRPQTAGEILLSAPSGEQRIITVSDQGTIASTGIVADASGGVGDGDSSADSSDEESSEDSSDLSSGASQASLSSGASVASTGGSSGASQGTSGASSTGNSNGNSAGGSLSSGASVSRSSLSSGASVSAGTSNGGALSSGASSTVTVRCEDRFSVAVDGTIQTTGKVNAKVRALGSDITYGAGGPEIQVTAQWSTNGTTWTNLYNGVDIDGGELETLTSIAANTRLSFKAKGVYSSYFNKSYTTTDATGHIDVLRNGERVPNYPVFNNQASIETFLRPYIVNGKIAVGEYDAIILVELGDLNTTSADFQDLVLLVQFEQEAGSCAGSSGSSRSGSAGSAVSGASVSGASVSAASSAAAAVTPRFKVVFDRLQNVGTGNAARAVYVGNSGVSVAENTWIPLYQLGAWITDATYNEDVAGLAVQRMDGKLRVVNHGSLANDNNKEIIDARIIFEGVTVAGVGNDTSGNNATENWIDGKTADNAGGDEVTVADDDTYVLFQTRTTTADDGIYIYFLDPSSPEAVDLKYKDRSKKKKIEICHFTGNGDYNTLTVAESSWKAHEKHGDHLGSCEGDTDADLIPNFKDLCPGTKVDNPKKYLLFLRYGLTENYSDIFREGPREKIGEFDLADTMGCSCDQLLDIAEGKSGYYMTNLPKLYLQLRSLLDFYVTTARKFGCSRDLLRMIEKNS